MTGAVGAVRAVGAWMGIGRRDEARAFIGTICGRVAGVVGVE